MKKEVKTRKIRDLSVPPDGPHFGRLTVIKQRETRSPEGLIVWVCKCTCGRVKHVRGVSLLAGHSQSCGCLQKERARESRLAARNIHREEIIVQLRQQGKTCQQIGDALDVTRQRVSAIVRRYEREHEPEKANGSQ